MPPTVDARGREETSWQGDVLLHLGHEPVGRWRLPRTSSISVGRLSGAGIRLRPAWVPREVCVLEPVRDGWLLSNRSRTLVRAESLWVTHASFEPGALVLLHGGQWRLEWDLDRLLVLEVRVLGGGTRPLDAPYALDARVGREAPADALGTLFAAQDLRLSPLAKHRLAVLFQHVIEMEPAPDNVYAAYADRFHERNTDEWDRARLQVRSMSLKTREKINKSRRGNPLADVTGLGHYLVTVTETLTEEDLTP